MSFCGPPGQTQVKPRTTTKPYTSEVNESFILLIQVTMSSGRNEMKCIKNDVSKPDTHLPYKNMWSNIKLVSFLETNTIELKNTRTR